VAPDIAGLAAFVAVCLDAPADSVRTLAARTATAPAAIAALTISVQRRAFIPLFLHPAHPERFHYEQIAAWRREPALGQRSGMSPEKPRTVDLRYFFHESEVVVE
jgi:hypothetical protein